MPLSPLKAQWFRSHHLGKWSSPAPFCCLIVYDSSGLKKHRFYCRFWVLSNSNCSSLSWFCWIRLSSSHKKKTKVTVFQKAFCFSYCQLREFLFQKDSRKSTFFVMYCNFMWLWQLMFHNVKIVLSTKFTANSTKVLFPASYCHGYSSKFQNKKYTVANWYIEKGYEETNQCFFTTLESCLYNLNMNINCLNTTFAAHALLYSQI